MRECTRYRTRAPGPLWDRIEMHVEAPRGGFHKLTDECLGESAAGMPQLQVSTRAFHRILKLLRTTADLAGSEQIAMPYVLPGQYRHRLSSVRTRHS